MTLTTSEEDGESAGAGPTGKTSGGEKKKDGKEKKEGEVSRTLLLAMQTIRS